MANSGVREFRESKNSGNGEFGNRRIQESENSGIREFGNSGIRESEEFGNLGNSGIGKSGKYLILLRILIPLRIFMLLKF